MEIWKDIIWYEWLYQVSNLWYVKSLNYKRNWKEKILKSWISWKWYIQIKLCKNWLQKTYILHRLLLQSFMPNPQNKPAVNHINWIKNDNRLENLEWCTYKENSIHCFNILWFKWSQYWKFWKDNPSSKKVNQYDLQWNFIKTWDCIKDIEKELEIRNECISRCCKWKYKTSWWYKWEYFS